MINKKLKFTKKYIIICVLVILMSLMVNKMILYFNSYNNISKCVYLFCYYLIVLFIYVLIVMLFRLLYLLIIRKKKR